MSAIWHDNYPEKVKKPMATKRPSNTASGAQEVEKLLHELDLRKSEAESREGELRSALLARARAEELLGEKSAELTDANRELDSFTSLVTHGLRNNLQTITGFSQTLFKFYYDSLDETGKDCLTRIQAGTKKMKSVMESLSELSRVSMQEILRENVDLSEIARSFFSELRGLYPQRSVDCVILPGLCAVADPGLARILIENLLKNAWKFTLKNEHARIEFGALQEKGATVFFVRDNGVGFNPDHADRLFRPFQLLHKEEEFKGTGMGLTIVKRIVARHGGWVRAEGEKGKGAAFFFQFSKYGCS
jgi:light-regulated signal transduction histidine kinase (bacteriophytochrome)